MTPSAAVAPCRPQAWKVDLHKFVKNMAILRSCQPGFAKWLEAGPPGTEFELAPTGSRHPDLQFTKGLETSLVYGVEDPRELARNAPEINLNDHAKVILLFGLGLGYLAISLISRLCPWPTHIHC